MTGSIHCPWRRFDWTHRNLGNLQMLQGIGTRGVAGNRKSSFAVIQGWFMLISFIGVVFFFGFHAMRRRYPYCEGAFGLLWFNGTPSWAFLWSGTEESKKGNQEKQFLSTSLSLSPQIAVPQTGCWKPFSALEILLKSCGCHHSKGKSHQLGAWHMSPVWLEDPHASTTAIIFSVLRWCCRVWSLVAKLQNVSAE